MTSAEPQATGSTDARGRWARRVLLAASILLGLLYVAGWVATGLRMPANAEIGGVNVGGMAPEAAGEKLRRTLSSRVGNEVVLAHGQRRFELDPEELGLELDVAESVKAAGGRHSLDPRNMAALLFGKHESDLVIRSSAAALDDAVAGIAADINRRVVQPYIRFPEGKPKPRRPSAGLAVMRQQTAEAITDAYLVATKPTPVPVARIEPAVDQAGLDRAMKTIAEPAVSAPITLRAGGKTYELPVSAYAPALLVRVEGDALKPHLDPRTLAKPLTDSATGIGQNAADARIDIVRGKPKIYPGKPGVSLQPAEMARKLLPVLTKTGQERSVTIDTKVVDPEFTTEEARKLNIKELMGEFTTYFPHAEYRNVNQGRAAELVDGTLLMPGETFSLNSTVGQRTKANGFVKGFVISGGVFREEQGGGVSQVATTIYNAAFFAGLEDVEHHPHELYIDRYPMGREATVYFGQLDLRFRNNTKNGVLMKASVVPSTWSAKGQMHVELWGTKVWDIKAGLSKQRNFRKPKTKHDDSKKCVPSAPVKGFDVDVHRRFYRNGDLVKTETDTTRYAATPKVICDDDDD
jgi:vancomycin resistance protein YoaR